MAASHSRRALRFATTLDAVPSASNARMVRTDASISSAIVVNPSIRAAVLLTTGKLFSVREDVVVGTSVSALPNGAQSLLWPYRLEVGA